MRGDRIELAALDVLADEEPPPPQLPSGRRRVSRAFNAAGTAGVSAAQPVPPLLVEAAVYSPVAPAPRSEVQRVASRESPAEAGYRLLTTGDRRGAAENFRTAVAESPDDPRAAAWDAQRKLLEERWSGSAYTFLRASGASGATAAPVLGGGQSGALLAWSLDPLARQPVSAIARVSVANGDADSAQGAIGLSWRLTPNLSVAAERLVPLANGGRAAWNLRLAGGYDTPERPGQGHWFDLSAYGESGVVGERSRDLYAAGAIRAGERFAAAPRVGVWAGAGLWGSVQRSLGVTSSRLEAGPALRLTLAAPVLLALSADYRIRIAGNALPDSGPALTVSTSF